MGKKEMILALIEHYSNGNKAQFASLLGITPQGLSTWIKRESFDIELIFSKCEGISAQWLLTGNGEMLKDDKREVAHQTENPKEGIPLIPFSAMAGALTGEQSALEYECERYVVPAFHNADFLMPVKGNSMTPTYISGDIVACQRVPMTDIFFQWNKPYVLDTSQGAIIKRIKPGSDKDHVLIVSDNKEYDPFELPYKDIYAVALVIGLIRLE
jgi:phage repressor protein C with HTH and peptisase S24 domain